MGIIVSDNEQKVPVQNDTSAPVLLKVPVHVHRLHYRSRRLWYRARELYIRGSRYHESFISDQKFMV